MNVSKEWYAGYLQKLSQRQKKWLDQEGRAAPNLGAGAERAHPQPEHAVSAGSLGQAKVEEGDPDGGCPRFIVAITSYRVQLTDPDNLCPKYLIDSLRYHGWIPDDTPDLIELRTRQVKVSHKNDERTVVKVYDRLHAG